MDTSPATRNDSIKLASILNSHDVITHLYDKDEEVFLTCPRLVPFNDNLIVVLEIDNRSSSSFLCRDAIFALEAHPETGQGISYERIVPVKIKEGLLDCPPQGKARKAYLLDLPTLVKGHDLMIHILEDNGLRRLNLRVCWKDIEKIRRRSP